MARKQETSGQATQVPLGKQPIEPGPTEALEPAHREALLLEEILRAQAQEALRAKVGRNEPCPCGSGKKYKRCCLHRHKELLSKLSPLDRGPSQKLQKAKALCEEKVKEGYELLGRRQFQKAFSLAQVWAQNFPKDDRFKDILVTASLQMGRPRQALQLAQESYRNALAEKEHFLEKGCHSWEASKEQEVGHVYAPEAWLERLWVARKAVDYQESFPKEPDPEIMKLVKELQKAEDPDKYPQGREEGLRLRQKALANVLEELRQLGPKALPYLLPLCPKYGWSGLLVPQLLVQWADSQSIRALVDLAMFRYPYLSESCLKGLEDLGEDSIAYLKEAFSRDPEMDPIKTGLLSVAGEIGTPEAMEWLSQMLEHPSAAIVNWVAGILGRKKYQPALSRLKAAEQRVGRQPYIIWAMEQLEGDQTSS